jgi:hypothetical protein
VGKSVEAGYPARRSSRRVASSGESGSSVSIQTASAWPTRTGRDARGADRQVGQLQDLACLVAELRLLVELDAVEVPVHAQVVLVGRLAAQPLHRLGAAPETDW